MSGGMGAGRGYCFLALMKVLDHRGGIRPKLSVIEPIPEYHPLISLAGEFFGDSLESLMASPQRLSPLGQERGKRLFP